MIMQTGRETHRRKLSLDMIIAVLTWHAAMLVHELRALPVCSRTVMQASIIHQAQTLLAY